MHTCRVLASVAGVVVASVALSGQPARPTATLSAVVERERIEPGSSVRLALLVTLPEGLHVQSNAPKDPSLIATTLTLEAPAGVAPVETVYPRASDLAQNGQTLAVFDREFVVGVRLILGSKLPFGDLAVPARLRYQACDERVCYTPATARVAWTLHVVPSAASTRARHPEVFGRIAFSRESR